jgi:hypothetical protein
MRNNVQSLLLAEGEPGTARLALLHYNRGRRVRILLSATATSTTGVRGEGAVELGLLGGGERAELHRQGQLLQRAQRREQEVVGDVRIEP